MFAEKLEVEELPGTLLGRRDVKVKMKMCSIKSLLG
jgi:hypothetical protein